MGINLNEVSVMSYLWVDSTVQGLLMAILKVT